MLAIKYNYYDVLNQFEVKLINWYNYFDHSFGMDIYSKFSNIFIYKGGKILLNYKINEK